MKLTIFCLIFVFTACLAKIVSRSGIDGYKKDAKKRSNQLALSDRPQNLAVLAGDTATLVCVSEDAASSRILWGEYVWNPDGTVGIISDGGVVLPGHPQAARYSIDTSTANHFDLQIASTISGDGGQYLCQDQNDGPPNAYRGFAELVVLEAITNCSSPLPSDGIVIEGQYYSIECTINYKGNIAPRMTWTGPPPFESTSSNNGQTVWSGMHFTVDRSMDTRSYSLLTDFADLGATPDDVASNAPAWSNLWRSNQLFVYWGPTNLVAIPDKQYYEVGDVITCSSDAFPAATHTWMNMATNEVIPNRQFTIDESFVGKTTLMRCQAQNLINIVVYTANLFKNYTVLTPTTTTPSTTLPTTTPPLPEAPCDVLTGRWQSTAASPKGELCVRVYNSTGEFVGTLRNSTNPYWLEIVGRSRAGFDQLAFNGITPYEEVQGFAGTCFKCYGVEYITLDILTRAITDSAGCGDGGSPWTSPTITLTRTDDSC